MKKQIALILAFLLILTVFVSCGNDTGTETSTRAGNDVESATEDVTESVSESESASESQSESESVTETVTETETETETEEPAVYPRLMITEIGFNPTYTADEALGLKNNDDVFEYIEIYNPTSEPQSFDGCSVICRLGGYDAEAKTNRILAPSGNTFTVSPGGIAVLAVYNKFTAKRELGYADDAEIEEYRQAFNAFYEVEIPAEAFFVCPGTESGSATAVEGGFSDLSNNAAEIVYQLVDGTGEVVSEVHYDQNYWNRNNRSCIFAFPDGGEEEGHPLASRVLGAVYPMPYRLADSQIYRSPKLTPTGETSPLTFLEFNISAGGIDTVSEGMEPEQAIAYRKQAVLDMITGYNADVTVLCEVNYVWSEVLCEELLADGAYGAYGYSGRGIWFEEMKDSQWDLCNLILWNAEKYELADSGYFWLSSDPDHFSNYWSNGAQNDMIRVVNWVILRDKESGAEFSVFGVHLQVSKYAAAQLNSANLIFERAQQIVGDLPVILAGDWNISYSTGNYDVLISSVFDDAAYLTADTWLGGSATGWGKYVADMQSRFSIDHLLVSPYKVFVDSLAMDIGEFEEGVYASDHAAVFCRLRLSLPSRAE